MSYDIWGNTLRSGHCEVHPWVHEEYPCSVCMAENREYQMQKERDEEARRAYEDEYYREMASEAAYHEIGFPIC